MAVIYSSSIRSSVAIHYFSENMKINEQLTITDCAAATDGGSVILMSLDAKGQIFDIFLPQHVMPGNFNEAYIPGRLHLNEIPIEIRSARETEIINKLKEAQINIEGEEEVGEIRQLLEEIIAFVQSDEYLSIGEKFSNYGK